LQTHFNPEVEHALAQTAEILQAEVEYLELPSAAENGSWGAGELGSWGKYNLASQINRRVLQTAPLALQRRVMRQVLQQTLAISAPSFEQIEKLTALITALIVRGLIHCLGHDCRSRRRLITFRMRQRRS